MQEFWRNRLSETSQCNGVHGNVKSSHPAVSWTELKITGKIQGLSTAVRSPKAKTFHEELLHSILISNLSQIMHVLHLLKTLNNCMFGT